MVRTIALWLVGLILAGAADFETTVFDMVLFILPRFKLWNHLDRLWDEGGYPMLEFSKSVSVSLLYCVLFAGAGLMIFKREQL